MNYDKSHNMMNRQERQAQQEERIRRDTEGSGVFIFENNSNAELILPKFALDGKTKKVGPHRQFQGDSYFLRMVGPSPKFQLSLVAQIEAQKTQTQPSSINEAVQMRTEKLILDQPDTVTDQGKVENVRQVPDRKQKPLNEEPTQTPHDQGERLLTEDPIDGVQFLA